MVGVQEIIEAIKDKRHIKVIVNQVIYIKYLKRSILKYITNKVPTRPSRMLAIMKEPIIYTITLIPKEKSAN